MDSFNLEYFDDAKINVYYFYEGINDVNFFVEDNGKSYLYETIFDKIFDKEIKIDKIFDMNGKNSLISAFKEIGHTSKNGHKAKNFYLADGDFDKIIKFDEMINDHCFYYLDCYNIENCLINKDSIELFTKGKLQKTNIETEKILNYNGWRERIIREMTPLFIDFCYIQKYHPSIPTITRPKGEYLDFKTGFKRNDIDLKKYINDILQPNAKEIVNIVEIQTAHEKIYSDPLDFICGKFLLKSVSAHIKKITGKKFSDEEIEWHLVTHFNSDKLDNLKNSVLSTL